LAQLQAAEDSPFELHCKYTTASSQRENTASVYDYETLTHFMPGKAQETPTHHQITNMKLEIGRLKSYKVVIDKLEPTENPPIQASLQIQ
jgi:hypothetical protein